jgi:hypothetical protein
VNILKQAPRQAGDLAALIARYVGKSLSDIQIDFPEVRAAGGIAALAADIGGFRKDLVLMQNAAGQADEAFARMTGGLSVELNKVRMAVMDLMTSIGETLAPTLKAAGEWFRKAIASAGEWVKQNRGFIVSTLKVAAAMVGVGIGMTVLGTIISGLGTGLGVLATVVATVMAVLKTLATVIVFLTSPVGLIIAGVAALGAVLLHVTGAGSKALGWLGDRFKVLKEDALASFGGIADALAAGDIALAARILWLTLKMEWTRGVNFLEKAWLNFRNFFIRIGYDAWHGLLATVEIVWHALEVGWIETTAFFARLWANFAGFFARSWQEIKAGAQKAWNWIKSLFDDTIDLKAENTLVEEQKQAAISRIDDDQARQVAEREAQRGDERRRTAAQHEAALAGIGQANLDKRRELEEAYAGRMAGNEADLAKARREWREAIDAARSKRAAKEAGGDASDPAAKVRDAISGLGDIGDIVRGEAGRIGVRGTFNAAAIRGLVAGNAADRTASATEETARNTKKLVQSAQSGGLAFA